MQATMENIALTSWAVVLIFASCLQRNVWRLMSTKRSRDKQQDSSSKPCACQSRPGPNEP